MGNRIASTPHRLLGQAAVIALVAGLTGCSSEMSRVAGTPPLFTGSTANQRAIIDGNASQQQMPPAYGTAPTGAVESAALPPAYGSSQPYNSPSNGSQSYGGASYGSSSYGSQPVSVASNAMPAGGSQFAVVAPGDTLYSIARRHGVSVDTLAAANSISNPSHLPVGRQLILPAGAMAYAAPAQPAPSQPTMLGAPPSNLGTVSESDIASVRSPSPVQSAQSAGPAGQHVVASGETVNSIARKYGVGVTAITNANGLASANQIRIGQRLTIPGAGTQVASAAPRPMPSMQAAPAPAAQQTASLRNPAIISDVPPVPAIPQTGALQPPPLPAVPTMPVQVGAGTGPTEYTPPRTPTQTAALEVGVEPASADGTSFRWPVRGRIISSFGTKPNGERNDGINLAVPEGTSIKAAEAGTVIYSGNEIAGYGNLILVRHAGGWVSAYAHNRTNGVQRGETVKRGQNIAEAGQTGTVNSPQLHFELRKGSNPVNPLDHLSGT